jgi:hypothetical protein
MLNLFTILNKEPHPIASIFPAFCLLLSSCFTSMYTTREPALVKNTDIDETLKIARDEMQKEGISQGLGIWVLRDQVVTPKQARTIAKAT